MICLDTTFLIDFFKKRIKVTESLDSYLSNNLAITPFTIFELYYGLYKLKRKDSKFNFEKREEKTKILLNKLIMLNYNENAAKRTAEILNNPEKQGITIDLVDIMIASTALAQNCEYLLTRNVDHFKRISGLVIITYEVN